MAERTVLVRLKAINDDYKRAMRESSEETTKLSKNIKGLQASSGDLKDVGSKMQRNLTLPIAGTSAVATKLGVDFDTAFSRMVGLANVPRGEIDGLKRSVLDLAHETGRAPQDLAEALYYIRSSGVSAGKSLDVLRAAARASAGGLGSTADVAKAVGFAINAYGEQNLSAAKATDILVAAVREGTIEADALAPVMGRLIPTASALGVGFDQVAGTLAVMSRTGLDAEEASTSLSAVFSTLLGTTKQGTALLEEKGLSLKRLREVAAGPGGVVAVMRMLGDAFHNDDEALATIIPNVRAFRAFMNVLAQDAGSVDQVLQSVANSTGAADEAFESWAMSKGAKLETMFSDAKAALIRFGDTIDPLIGLLTLIGSAGAAAFGWLPEMGQQGVASILLVIAALGPLLSIVGTIGNNLKMLHSGLMKMFQLIQTGALNAVGSIGAIGLALGAVALVLAGVAVAWWRTEQAAKASRQRVDEYAAAIRNAGSVAGGAAAVVEGLLQKQENMPILEAMARAGVTVGEFTAAVAAGGAEFDKLRTKIIAALAEQNMTGTVKDELDDLGVSVDDLIEDLGRGGNGMKVFGANTPSIPVQNFVKRLRELNGEILPIGNEFSRAAEQNALFNDRLGTSTTSANAAEARILGLTGGVQVLGEEARDTAADLKAMLDQFDGIYARAFGVLDAQLDYADALDQVGKSSDSAAGSTRDLAAEERQAVRAAEAVTKAQLDLAKAEAALVEARKGPSDREKLDANLGVREAQLGLAEAVKAEQDARKKVNEERKKGREGDVKGATLDLQRAQLALQRAQLAVTDSQAEQNRVLNSGAETSEKVQSALDDVTSATERLRDAQWSQEEQQNRAVSGTGRVVDKHKELRDQIDAVIERGTALIRKMIEMGAPGGEVLVAIANQAAAIDEIIEKYGDVNGKLALQKQALLEIAILKGLPATYNAETGFVYYELPKRAAGGPVSAGMPYLVGERGPEVFTPGSSGTIVPNHQLTAASSYSGGLAPFVTTVSLPVVIDGIGTIATGLMRLSYDQAGLDIRIRNN